jgi:hypothetical protein
MAITFYDASVANYLQTLGGVHNVLAKGEQCAEQGKLDLEAIVDYRLREDMLGFTFQVVSVWHHSLGAIRGMQAGLFEPPPKLGKLDYTQLQGLVSEAMEELQALPREDVDALADKSLVFKLGETEIPFTTDNFVLSFSLPNFYFHATTTYDILRLHGVPLGKMDFLGPMRTA